MTQRKRKSLSRAVPGRCLGFGSSSLPRGRNAGCGLWEPERLRKSSPLLQLFTLLSPKGAFQNVMLRTRCPAKEDAVATGLAVLARFGCRNRVCVWKCLNSAASVRARVPGEMASNAWFPFSFPSYFFPSPSQPTLHSVCIFSLCMATVCDSFIWLWDSDLWGPESFTLWFYIFPRGTLLRGT